MGILNFLFPKTCIGCKKKGSYFCPDCAQSAKLHFPQVCPVCEQPSPDGVRHTYCDKHQTPNGLHSIWAYEGTPRKLIIKFKYRFISDIADELAETVAAHLKNYRPLSNKGPVWTEEKFTVVPIPLHWKRENWRGFNQSEELGKRIANKMGWDFQNLLVRAKRTKHQVGLRGKARRENVEGVFSLNPNIPTSQYSNVLLFDDVWTTGATMKEAAKIIKQAGVARQVWCLTLAR
ncbi:MAG: ComF family protein [Patescibacteria group bacterium]